METTNIMFACVHNAGRSQIAAAFFNKYIDNPNMKGLSAGTNPASQVHDVVIQVMKEVGIDLTDIKPIKLTEDLAKQVDMIVTMGCGESCPYVPGVKIIDWQIPDPKGQTIENVREIRDVIEGKIKELISSF